MKAKGNKKARGFEANKIAEKKVLTKTTTTTTAVEIVTVTTTATMITIVDTEATPSTMPT